MAAGDPQIYNTGILNAVVLGSWDNDDHYFMLLDTSYTPSLTHSTRADVSSAEISDSDYAKLDMSGESSTNNAGVIEVDADDANFGSSVTIEAKYLVCLMGTAAGSSGTDDLVFYVDLNTDSGSATLSSTSGNFLLAFHGDGIFKVSRHAP